MNQPCPICEAPASTRRDNRWRPFCSERCKNVDLGRWLGGEYAIPGPPASTSEIDPTRPDSEG